MSIIIFSLILGIAAGFLGGLLGIGGGMIVVPALVYILHYSQHSAQGTTLAMMVLPVGLLAALTYYKSGNVNLTVALIIAAGFFVGGLLGANVAISIPNDILKKIFGVSLLLVAIHMIFLK